jgi:uncharacterized protein
MTPSTVAAERDRLHVLDVLRGIALIGMFFVHFSMLSTGGTSADKIYQNIVALFFEERFWTMFAILFGVGFAIQLRRADARGDAFVPKYLRRIGMLAVFGFIAEAFFGFNVLLTYALWGLPLLLVRRWSVKQLVVAAVVCAVSWNIYTIAKAGYLVATKGEQGARAALEATDKKNQAHNEANQKAQDATSYKVVLAARLEHMKWFYAQPFSFLPVNSFMLFLLGFIALRLGIFDGPERHRRLIATLAVVGTGLWAVEAFVLPKLPAHTTGPLVQTIALNRLQSGFGLVRDMWLSFAYMGVVLLLVAHNRDWLRRLAPLGWTGRMALTNYMIQVAFLDLTFSKYGVGLEVRPLVGLTMAIALFAVDALFSRWWLARFRYGPLEWLWRSATYARWQPLRLPAAGESVSAGLAAVG